MIKAHSPAPWTYREDILCYYVLDAKGEQVAIVMKNANKLHGLPNLHAILAVPDLLQALRRAPAYSDDWKQNLRHAYSCACGIVDSFLPARKKK